MDLYLTIDDVAARLRLERAHVASLIAHGSLAHLDIAGEIRIPAMEVLRFEADALRPRGARLRLPRTAAVIVFLGLLVGFGTGRVAADTAGEAPIRRVIPYRGTLESNGSGISSTIGLHVRIEDGAGVVLWEDTFQSVSVAAGSFAVDLGSQAPITAQVLSSRDALLHVAVLPTGGGAEVDLAGRQRLFVVPSEAAAATTTPPGTIVAFAGDVPPPGWLLCDGRVVGASAYPALFAAIGTKWGAPSGTPPSFNLPDLRGRFLRGVGHGAPSAKDNGSRVASNANGNSGDAVGSLQAESFSRHQHSGTTAPENLPPNTGGMWFDNADQGIRFSNAGSTGIAQNLRHTHSFITDEAGGPETRPVNVNVEWIVKY